MIQQRAVTFGDRLQFAKQVRELRHVEPIDFPDFGVFLGVAAMMRLVAGPDGATRMREQLESAIEQDADEVARILGSWAQEART